MMEAEVRRNAFGELGVLSKVDLGNGKVLRIETSKWGRGDLRTHVAAVTPTEGGYSHVFGAAGKGDWSKTVARATGRATEKSLTALHSAALGLVDQLVAEAKAYYEKWEKA